MPTESKARKLADIINGTEGNVVGYDDNGEIEEVTADSVTEDTEALALAGL